MITLLMISLIASPVSEIHQGFSSITDLHAITLEDQHYVVIYDYADRNYPLKIYDSNEGKITKRIRSGAGPGELSSSEGIPLSFSTLKDEYAIIYDNEQFRGMLYDADFEFVSDLSGLDDYRLRQFAVQTDTTALGMKRTSQTEPLMHFGLQFSDEQLQVIESKKLKTPSELEPVVKNSLLRQGRSTAIDGRSLYSFTYSSYLLSVSDHVEWVNGEPENYTFPDYDGVEILAEGATRLRSPDVTEHPIGTLDIAANRDYIFKLYSGKNAESEGWLSRLTNDISIDTDELFHATRLIIYDHEGNQLKETTTPMDARTLAVTDSRIYLGSEMEDKPVIREYRLEDLINIKE